MTAIFSPCGRYRYTLERPIALAPKRLLLWCGLNPSKAGATQNDATVSCMVRFTRDWGYDGLLLGNLFAFIATKPLDLWAWQKAGGHIVGPDNDSHLNQLALRASAAVLCWGTNAERAPQRAEYVRRLLSKRLDLYALGFTNSGQPMHPLRQSADLQLVRCEA
jgi:hypothetical protein